MSLSGRPPDEGMVHPELWTTARLGGTAEASARKARTGY
jgi:hypothetical protein